MFLFARLAHISKNDLVKYSFYTNGTKLIDFWIQIHDMDS